MAAAVDLPAASAAEPEPLPQGHRRDAEQGARRHPDGSATSAGRRRSRRLDPRHPREPPARSAVSSDGLSLAEAAAGFGTQARVDGFHAPRTHALWTEYVTASLKTITPPGERVVLSRGRGFQLCAVARETRLHLIKQLSIRTSIHLILQHLSLMWHDIFWKRVHRKPR